MHDYMTSLSRRHEAPHHPSPRPGSARHDAPGHGLPRHGVPRFVGALALGAALLFAAAGCSNADGSVGPTDLPPGPTAGPATATPAFETFDPGSAVTTAILGSWLPKPIAPSLVAATAATVETACRVRLAAAGGATTLAAAAPRVIADFRGLGQAWLIFSDGAHAAGCRATLGPDLAPTITGAGALTLPGSAPADDKFEFVAYGTLADVDSGRTFAIGRMGRLSVDVIATFPDESFAFATLGSGWYLVWWPGNTVPVGIGGVDSRHLTVQGLPPPAAPIP